MSKKTDQATFTLRNPWPKFQVGDKVGFTEQFMKYYRTESHPASPEGTVLAVRDCPPDKTGLVDTYVKVKWDDGIDSEIHAGHLEAV